MGYSIVEPVCLGTLADNPLWLPRVLDVRVFYPNDQGISQMNNHEGDQSSQRIGFVQLSNYECDSHQFQVFENKIPEKILLKPDPVELLFECHLLSNTCLLMQVIKAQTDVGNKGNEHNNTQGSVPSEEPNWLVLEVDELQTGSPHNCEESEANNLV